MPTNDKNNQERNQKDSFWKRIGNSPNSAQKKASLIKNSLVETIIHQAEKESGYGPKDEHNVSEDNENRKEQKKAFALLSLSKTLLTLIIIASIGAWFYFSATLNESNFIYGKFDKQNLTVQVNYKTELLAQIKTDNRDTQKFNKLLHIESLANKTASLDLENPILNYAKPDESRRAIPRSGEEAIYLYKTVDSEGNINYSAESDILRLANAREITTEIVQKTLAEIFVEAENLTQEIKVSSNIEEGLEKILNNISKIDLEEENFPSATTKEYFRIAKSAAQKILIEVKDFNLKNLVADIKKQSQAIDISSADEATLMTVNRLREILGRLSYKRPSSFDTALTEVSQLNLSALDDATYQQVIQITGDLADSEKTGDLQLAAVIAQNRGRVNIINELKNSRITWSNVIEHVEKIARIGADLERDIDSDQTDARKDIDPSGKLITFLGYAGKARNNEIEIRGQVIGKHDYKKKEFTLLADLIDALEGSKYFQDVEGFSFSKSKDIQGGTIAPLNLKLYLQDPETVHPSDVDTSIKRSSADEEPEGFSEEIESLEFSSGLEETDESINGEEAETDEEPADTELEEPIIDDNSGAAEEEEEVEETSEE